MEEAKLHSCCISHQFSRIASENLSKHAVVHASGGAEIIKRHRAGSDGRVCGRLWEEFSGKRVSGFPPIYDGDCSFRFGEVLDAVELLAARISCVLDGGDDAGLIRTQNQGWGLEHKRGSGLLKNLRLSTGECFDENKNYFPKVVGIYMLPSVEYVVSVLAVLRCGEAFVPLDPSWPRERILSIQVDLIIGCDFLIGAEHWLVKFGKAHILCMSMEDRRRDAFDLSPVVWPCEKEKQRAFCYVMYTSGTTGKPKGVYGTELGLLNRYLWMQESYPMCKDENMLFKTSISYIDHIQEFLGAVLAAATMVIPPLDMIKENLFHLVDLLQVYQISRLTCVPTLMKLALPALGDVYNDAVLISLKLLILSGEVFPLSLWESLSKILKSTIILNLYGSTEVSGDCTYFDCKRLPQILKNANLISVPIGQPLPNCQVVLAVSDDASKSGEICVGGHCISSGYTLDQTGSNSDFVKLTEDSSRNVFTNMHGSFYYRTGDFASQLDSLDLIFEGRKDRTVKVNGHRIALEEIENTLRGHPIVVDAAVLYFEGPREVAALEAYLILKHQEECDGILPSSIHHWMVDKLPLEMIPNYFFFTQYFPLTSTGKVDYISLGVLKDHAQTDIVQTSGFLQAIQKAFSSALMAVKVSQDDDFFLMGGNSVGAAHVAHQLGIDMRLLYMFPTPFKLQMALIKKEETGSVEFRKGINWEVKQNLEAENTPAAKPVLNGRSYTLKRKKTQLLSVANEFPPSISKCSKSDVSYENHWAFKPLLFSCSFSRCNKIMFEGDCTGWDVCQLPCIEVPKNVEGSIRHLWKVHMDSCVDASPVVVYRNQNIYLFIGSHSHKFLCVNATSGYVEWEVKLNGRIECSPAIVGDFSQVVVGCYDGNIYFLDFLTGVVCWTFQTGAEVKSQPVVDIHRKFVWCGSHDQFLYALDYENYCCVYMHPCGGSIFGSPIIDEALHVIYVASTNGCVSAILIKALPFSSLWQQQLNAPIFGSLALSSDGNVICCSVDGQIVALNSAGMHVWKFNADGPIFAGPSISHALPSQVLVCCRDGRIYSLKQETGHLLWDYNVGDPIIASAYIEENLQLVSNPNFGPDVLLCVCSSSGIVQLLRVRSNAGGENQSSNTVQEYARTSLTGKIFSSPVMIAGRIFVGCRDDYLHCLEVDPKRSAP